MCAFALSSCIKSKEKKAEVLLQEKLKSTLFHPDSYKAVSTEVDSAFINFDNLTDVVTICEELNDLLEKKDECVEKMDNAGSTIESSLIHDIPAEYCPAYVKSDYNDAKEEYEKYKKKLGKISPKISEKITRLKQLSSQLYDDEFSGWIVDHKFTSMNGDNTVSLSGEMIYFCDKDFTSCWGGLEKSTFKGLLKFLSELQDADDEEDIEDAVRDFSDLT